MLVANFLLLIHMNYRIVNTVLLNASQRVSTECFDVLMKSAAAICISQPHAGGRFYNIGGNISGG